MKYSRYKPKKLPLIIALSLSLFLVACGGNGSDSGATSSTTGGDDGDNLNGTAGFGVVSTSPSDLASGVTRDSNISATFSGDVFAVSVDTRSFSLADDRAVLISSNSSVDATTNTATLTPGVRLDYLAEYTATLSGSISDLDGNTMTTDYSWSFTTADGVWQNPVLLETDNRGTADAGVVETNGSGNAVAIWIQGDGDPNNDATRHNIWANHYTNGSWSSPKLIENGGIGDRSTIGSPDIVVDSNGRAIAIWTRADASTSNSANSGRHDVWSNYYDGTTWGMPALVETNDVGTAITPKVIFTGNGSAVAVWSHSDGSRYNIWANRFDGTGWGTPEVIQSVAQNGVYPSGNATFFDIATDDNGNVVVVWSQSDGTLYNIWSNYFNGTNWRGPELIETENNDQAYFPRVDLNVNGNAVAIWSQVDELNAVQETWVNHFDGINWGNAERVDNVIARSVSQQRIAMSPYGEAVAIWTQKEGPLDKFNMWANYFDGSKWGTAQLIENDDVADVRGFGDVVMDKHGNAIALWVQNGADSRDSVWSNRFDGSRWEGAVLVAPGGRGAYVDMALQGDGSAIAVWSQYKPGSYRNMWGSRFE